MLYCGNGDLRIILYALTLLSPNILFLFRLTRMHCSERVLIYLNAFRHAYLLQWCSSLSVVLYVSVVTQASLLSSLVLVCAHVWKSHLSVGDRLWFLKLSTCLLSNQLYRRGSVLWLCSFDMYVLFNSVVPENFSQLLYLQYDCYVLLCTIAFHCYYLASSLPKGFPDQQPIPCCFIHCIILHTLPNRPWLSILISGWWCSRTRPTAPPANQMVRHQNVTSPAYPRAPWKQRPPGPIYFESSGLSVHSLIKHHF